MLVSLKLTKKILKAKQLEETIRREQERIKREEETRRNELVRYESTQSKVIKTTTPTATVTHGAITPVAPQVKQANTKKNCHQPVNLQVLLDLWA